jgi:large subunit ribosomal protein L18
MKISRNKLRIRRKRRVRAKIFGTAKRPRLSVFRSLKNIYVQVIDDSKCKTLAAANLKEISAKAKKASNLEKAKELGKLITQKCAKLKISEVVFDRGGYKYHGKLKALAEGAREEGLKF